MQSVNIMENMQNYQLIITENMQKSEKSKMIIKNIMNVQLQSGSKLKLNC